MTDSLKQFWNELKTLWDRIDLNQRIGLGIVIALFIGALLMWGSWSSSGSHGLLFRDLDHKDAGEIVNILNSEGVSYRLEDNGTTILVDSSRVYDMRLKLAGQGLPGQNEGWSLFDQNRLGGLSEFVQKVNHTRALQGELERTISSIKQIEWAKVHLVEEKDSLFTDKVQPATASVLIKTAGTSQLSDAQVTAITHHIAGSVRGLQPEHVTITDYAGRQLSRPGSGEGVALASNQLDYRRQMEEHLSSRATQLLERVVGAGQAVVTVTADIDFSRSESKIIEYKDGVIRSTQDITRETTDRSPGGAAGIASNVRTAEAVSNGSTSSTREERTDYLPPVLTSEQRRVDPAGNVTRLAVAAFISAGHYTTIVDENGNEVRQYVPAPPAKMREYEQVVKNAIGFNATRGDVVTVSDSEFRTSTPFAENHLQHIETQQWREFIIGLAGSASTALAVLMLILFGRWMLKRSFNAPASVPQTLFEQAAEVRHDTVSFADADSQITHKDAVRSVTHETTTEVNTLRKNVSTAVHDDAARAAQYLKMWMNS